MSLIQMQQVCFGFGAQQLLTDITLHIELEMCTALVGANGSGKTTLLKIICGKIRPDSGVVQIRKNIKVAYLPQSGVKLSNLNLYEEVEKVFAHEKDLTENLKCIEEKLANNSIKDVEQRGLINEYAALQTRIESSEYYLKDKFIHRVLLGLGFKKNQFTLCCRHFSDGFKMRIALAKVLLQNAQVLLLDEPTNYLDLDACEWLKNYLLTYKGAVILVSHDKYFLNSTVRSVAELFMGCMHVYKGNFTDYEQIRKKQLEGLIKQYKHQLDEIVRLDNFIRRFRATASKAALVQSKLKSLNKIERIQLPSILKKIQFRFPDAEHSGRKVIETNNIHKVYGDCVVFDNVSMNISRGDRIAVVGANGVGKSTLLRVLAGVEPPDRGEVSYGKNVSIGYFSHDSAVHYTSSLTVTEDLESEAPSAVQANLRNMMGAFLFRGDDVNKRVSVLSGGERSRLLLLKLLVIPHNILICDEPTNHLDIASKDVLIDAFMHYSGTLIFVSHDRCFVESLAEKIFEIKNQTLTIYQGNYEYYLSKRDQEKITPEFEAKTNKMVSDSDKKAERKLKTSLKNKLRRLENEMEHGIKIYEELEQKQKDLEISLAQKEVYTDGEKMKVLKKELSGIEKQKKLIMRRWQELEDEVNRINFKLH